MKKITTFGSLRMLYMNLGKEPFKDFLIANYSKTEQKRISDAFLSIGTSKEVKGGKDLSDEANSN